MKYEVLTIDDDRLIASQHPTNNDMAATTLLNKIVIPLQGRYKNSEEIFYDFLDVLDEQGEFHEVMLDISHRIREDCSKRMINGGIESYRGTYLWGKIKEHRLFLQYYSKLAEVTDTDYELIVPQHAEDINSLQKSSERAKKLLILINIDLKCKKTETFYQFLTCINNHNQYAVRKLAETLNNLLQENPQQASGYCNPIFDHLVDETTETCL
ncbi:uncharacterized protein [Dysidea avara]|uniref:uncharacterized protein isoform X2 n=1 Tax=Dysidea avara TaxID=196820 RepID=UPI003327B24F